MALDNTINKDDPAAPHPSSSSNSTESKTPFTVGAVSHKVTSESDHAQGQDHPISSPIEALDSKAEPPKITGQSISNSQVDQLKSNNALITENIGSQDGQSDLGDSPDSPIPEPIDDEVCRSVEDKGSPFEYQEPAIEDAFAFYVHEDYYGQYPTASARTSPNSIITACAADRLFAIDYTVYRTD
jgi:hypothetical protein